MMIERDEDWWMDKSNDEKETVGARSKKTLTLELTEDEKAYLRTFERSEPVAITERSSEAVITERSSDENLTVSAPLQERFEACDGYEQLAFEKWAKGYGYDMHEHPLHYLFLDEQTNAARMGWNAALAYVRSVLAKEER